MRLDVVAFEFPGARLLKNVAADYPGKHQNVGGFDWVCRNGLARGANSSRDRTAERVARLAGLRDMVGIAPHSPPTPEFAKLFWGHWPGIMGRILSGRILFMGGFLNLLDSKCYTGFNRLGRSICKLLKPPSTTGKIILS